MTTKLRLQSMAASLLGLLAVAAGLLGSLAGELWLLGVSIVLGAVSWYLIDLAQREEN